jgi:hypothetical protein
MELKMDEENKKPENTPKKDILLGIVYLLLFLISGEVLYNNILSHLTFWEGVIGFAAYVFMCKFFDYFIITMFPEILTFLEEDDEE